MSKLSQEILMYRARNRLTQKQMAELCGVSCQTIHLIETEQQEPTRITLAKLMLVLGKEQDENEN